MVEFVNVCYKKMITTMLSKAPSMYGSVITAVLNKNCLLSLTIRQLKGMSYQVTRIARKLVMKMILKNM